MGSSRGHLQAGRQSSGLCSAGQGPVERRNSRNHHTHTVVTSLGSTEFLGSWNIIGNHPAWPLAPTRCFCHDSAKWK